MSQTLSRLVRDQNRSTPPATVVDNDGVWMGHETISGSGPAWSTSYTLSTPGWWQVTARIRIEGTDITGRGRLEIGDNGSSAVDLSVTLATDVVQAFTVPGSWLISPGRFGNDGYVLGEWVETGGSTSTVQLVWRAVRLRD